MFLKEEMHCHNRAPYKDTVWVQSGYRDANGIAYADRGMTAEYKGKQQPARLMLPLQVEIPNPMSKSCRMDVRFTHKGCRGCRWQTGVDPRDSATDQARTRHEVISAGLTPVLLDYPQ